MADTAQPGAAEQAGTPGQATAPDTKALEEKMAQLQRERDELKNRYSGAMRKVQEQGAELNRFRQSPSPYGGNTEETVDQGSIALSIAAKALARTETPDWQKYEPRIAEMLADPTVAAQYAPLDPYTAYRTAVKDLQSRDLAEENAKLRAQVEAIEKGRQDMAGRAVVSGTQTSPPSQTISQQDLAMMSADDMVRKGLVELAPNNPFHPGFAKKG